MIELIKKIIEEYMRFVIPHQLGLIMNGEVQVVEMYRFAGRQIPDILRRYLPNAFPDSSMSH
jgi:hypothetical protein